MDRLGWTPFDLEENVHPPIPLECENWDCTLLKNLIAMDNSPYCLQNGPAKMAGHSLATAKARFVSHTNMTGKINLSPEDIVDWLRTILGPMAAGLPGGCGAKPHEYAVFPSVQFSSI